MHAHLLPRVTRLGRRLAQALEQRLLAVAKPGAPLLVAGALADLARGKPALIAENALLRQQLIVLNRQVARPRLTTRDRVVLVLLAGRTRLWRSTLLIVQPDTLLRWHRQGVRLVWRARSRPAARGLRIAPDTVALIQEMARDNRLWGAERIRGELLKLGITLSKRTVQRYMRRARPPRRSGQTWATFLRSHAADVWACDFLQVTDLWFRSLFAFVIVEHASRRVVHIGVTRHPTDAWVAQQVREATLFGTAPRFLIHDNDTKFGPQFAHVAATTGIDLLHTPYHAPRANALCERFLGSVRRECLDHLLILHERHLSRVLKEYVAYVNHDRPHQGIGQAIPATVATKTITPKRPPPRGEGPIRAVPILGGLHHAYHRAREAA